ncbi:5-methyltetrahydropteroyltriglutamate--homocysteine S-methyltransferase [Amphibacillus sp. MSJ-3]|uniref:5-methyltetrahydropteroyltriglutamate-- homocysteine S-methyltransferase n=1 Tax=Amphibacillus sp. MSJ-3 TaxID=2841505 RepID=UPI001C0F1F0F|nr:5-methyltetrahydropteroyltriglutamate--homocysteine S-methyltransferase [Amphibacillus sp. MSJ-3]MBU5594062.1 5-methyltetrahydropteroyltriglutamate--homocysteine S-methyltransferase [Amphibacillus sp. MSJ-3]
MTIQAPFHADHVGSLLRPERLKKARRDYKEGKIERSELKKIEIEEVTRIVDKQIELGLDVVTDGEFRRDWWHIDFLENLNGFEGYVPEHGYFFEGVETEPYDVRNIGKISFNPDHPFIDDFKEFNKIVNGRAIAKQTIPSPNQLFHVDIINSDIYPDYESYAKDIIQAYRDAIQAFYDAGVRYLQIDDVYLAVLTSPDNDFDSGPYKRDYLIDLAVRVINAVLEGKPEDLIVTTHICRGNYQSTYAFQGSYQLIAPTVFAKEKVDGFFLEYDDDRSGDFEPLAHIPKGGAKVVLGLITSKHAELEDPDLIKARIAEAAKYVPLDQLCLSPQCGFASTHHGNLITEEDQWNKLEHVVKIAKEVWGD